ncbi:hypothetical protein [Streptomyces sp. S1]|uniref:hypothetical protein n=1 Tax=Streptomyces sp. S1 TaxID=718288 RepID=UPI003D70591B
MSTYEFRVDENGFLSAGAILEQPTLVIEELVVPEWGGGKIRLKMLSAKERDDFESSMVKMGKNGRQQLNNENFRARLVQLAAVDGEGKQLFTKHDIKTLGNLPAAGLQRVFNKINEMSAFSEDDLKDIAEDFDDDPTESSDTD